MYRYITINTNGSIRSEMYPKAPDWKSIQKYVDGSFQVVPYFTKYDNLKRGIAYCNEEALLKSMPFNITATKAWMESCPKGEPDRMHLHGPVLFVAVDRSTPDEQES